MKLFCYTTKKSRQNLIYFENKKRAFEVKWKAFSLIFNRILVAKNCLRADSAHLRSHVTDYLGYFTVVGYGGWCQIFRLCSLHSCTRFYLWYAGACGTLSKGLVICYDQCRVAGLSAAPMILGATSTVFRLSFFFTMEWALGCIRLLALDLGFSCVYMAYCRMKLSVSNNKKLVVHK